LSVHRNASILVLSLGVTFGAVLPSAAQTGAPARQKARPASPKPEAANSSTKAATGTAPSSASGSNTVAPGVKQPLTDEQVVITLERSVCYGTCPEYTVTIHGDGSVIYEGRDFVRVTGKQHGTAQREDVARLVDMFERAHFFDLKDRYSAQITDLPTYRVTYERNGRRKTVVDYAGEDAGMPHAVSEIEQEIDRVAQTEKWVRDPHSLEPTPK
jgi:hypothetical protein